MLVLRRINLDCVANDRLGIRCKDLLSKHENDWCWHNWRESSESWLGADLLAFFKA